MPQNERKEKPLQGWKEIAVYLDPDFSTATRWDEEDAVGRSPWREKRLGGFHLRNRKAHGIRRMSRCFRQPHESNRSSGIGMS